MANNKVQLANGTVLIDLTDSSLTSADSIASGVTAYDRSGTKLTGTLVVDSTYSVTKNLTDVSSSSDDTKVIQGNSFFTRLAPIPNNYVISSITVTMGGVDVTSQVFHPDEGGGGGADLGTKTIIENGTYNASSDNLDGYSQVTVNVPTGTARSSSDLTVSGATVTAPAGLYASNATYTMPTAEPYLNSTAEYYTDEGVRRWHIRPFIEVDAGEGDVPGYIADGTHIDGNYAEYPAVPKNTTITPSTQAQTVGGANYMMESAVTVAAMPSGTAGTPTATKGAVSNHSVSVTPSVTNTTGYITGSTKTGTAVTVSASELVSGNKEITANGTNIDVANYSTVSVAVPSSGGANFATATMTNSSNQAQSISFTLPSGRTPKAFFARLTSQIARNSSSRYYYVFDMRWDGSSTGGVAGNTFYMYSGTLSNVTSGYSHSQSNTTFTLSTTGTRSTSPGSFYNGTYELVYVY